MARSRKISASRRTANGTSTSCPSTQGCRRPRSATGSAARSASCFEAPSMVTDLAQHWSDDAVVLLPRDGAYDWRDGEVVFLTKYNPFHDELGRFASGPGGGELSISAGEPGLVEEPVGAGGPPPVAAQVWSEKDLPTGYHLKPTKDMDGKIIGYNVYQPNGMAAYEFSPTAEGAVEHFAQQNPGALLPEGYTMVGSDEAGIHGAFAVHDPEGQTVGVGESGYAALVDFKSNLSEGVITPPPASALPVTSTIGGKYELSAKDLPKGYT